MITDDIWRRGFPLAEADTKFGPEHLWRRHNRRSRRNAGVLRAPGWATDERVRPIYEAGSIITREALEISRRFEIRAEIRKWVLRALADGKLHAYGYPKVEDTISDQLVEIPPFMFVPECTNWESSSFKGLGYEFVSVRVSRANPVRGSVRTIQSDTPPETERQKPGPKSRGPLIDEAIRALVREGIDLNAKTEMAAGHLVRERVSAQTGMQTDGRRGFHDETIRRRIVILCKSPE